MKGSETVSYQIAANPSKDELENRVLSKTKDQNQ